MRSVHSGEKPFACIECNMKFSQQGNLTRHMMIHTGEKPFACNKCSKSFRSKIVLSNHVRTHQEVSLGENTTLDCATKSVACPECGKNVQKRNESEKSHENSRWRKTIHL